MFRVYSFRGPLANQKKIEVSKKTRKLYSQRIYRFAVKRLGDATEAENVVQDTFLEIHRCLG